MRIALILLTFASAFTAAQQLPTQLTDEEFWRMVTEFSESGGYFRAENFVSNEVNFQHVIPRLNETIKPGGVYLGVGPDQNFTYIVALEPKISFIVDIRRQNLLQHLMYKALFELSEDRADFLAKLFSRHRPEGLDENSTALELFDAYVNVQPSDTMYHVTLEAILETLTKKHGFRLSAEDLRTIEHVFSAFFDGGPDITYSGPYGGGRMPSYAYLMIQTDGQQRNRSYMGSEANFKILKEIQKRNLLVPLVGDFAGPKALRSVGAYVKEHGATVSAIYTSNVEQYLFQQADDWAKYYSNVETLPLDESSTFIRSQFNMGGYGLRGMPSRQLLCSVSELLKAFRAGTIKAYWDVINMSQ